MTTSTTDPTIVLRHDDVYASEHQASPHRRAATLQRGVALGYAWGARDHQAPGTPYVSSCDFADAYALATFLGEGYVPMTLSNAYATWAHTGRLVIRIYDVARGADVLVSIHAEDGSVLARHIPFTGDTFNVDALAAQHAYRVDYVHPHA